MRLDLRTRLNVTLDLLRLHDVVSYSFNRGLPLFRGEPATSRPELLVRLPLLVACSASLLSVHRDFSLPSPKLEILKGINHLYNLNLLEVYWGRRVELLCKQDETRLT